MPTILDSMALPTQLHQSTMSTQLSNLGAMSAQSNFQKNLLTGSGNSLGILQQLLGLFSGGANSSSSKTSGGNFGGVLKDELGNIDQMGAGRRTDINQSYHDSLGASMSALSDKGIGGGSFTTDAFAGAERNRQSSLNELNDQLLGAKNQAYNSAGLAGANSQQQQMMSILGPLLSSLLG